MTHRKGPDPVWLVKIKREGQLQDVCSRIIKICDEYLGKGQITYEEVYRQLKTELDAKEKNSN